MSVAAHWQSRMDGAAHLLEGPEEVHWENFRVHSTGKCGEEGPMIASSVIHCQSLKDRYGRTTYQYHFDNT